MGGMPELNELIERSFDRGTVERGLAYWRNGYVGELKQGPDFVEASVSGSEDYDVQIQLSGLNVGREGISVDELSGECSCPIGWQCKHVVAALAEWASRQGFPPQQRHRAQPAPRREDRPAAEPEPFPELDRVATRRWRDENPEAQRWSDDLVKQGAEAARARIGDLLFVFAPQGAQLVLEAVGSRRLKSGALGVGKRFSHLRQVRSPAGRDYATDDDLALIAMLLPFTGDYDGDKLLRRPPAFLIEHLLATGRCLWRDHREAPLRLIDPVAARMRWIERGGRWRIEFHDDRGRALDLVDTDPPLQRTDAGMGAIVVDAPRAGLGAVVAMPWLSAPLVRAIAESLPLPLPDGLDPLIAPLPRLRLARRVLSWRSAQGLHRRAADVAVVTFVYGDDELGAEGYRLTTSERGVPVTRDIASERERLGELARLGLRAWPPPGVQSADLASSLRDQPIQVAVDRVLAPGDDPVAISPATLVALRGSGWEIIGADGVPEATLIELGQISARVEDRDGGDWFEVQLGIEVDGRRIDLVPLLTPLLRGGPEAWNRLPRAAGEPPAVLATCGDTSVLRVPLALIETLHAQLIELFDQPPGPGGGWRVDAARADLIGALDHLSPRWIGGERLRRLAERLRSCLAPPAVAVPAGLAVELRPYQREGLAWLQHLAGLGLGGVLADDMGLGKTVQAIAHLMAERDAGRADRASLVICPASVVQVWRDQVARHAPGLRVVVLHGSGRVTVDRADGDLVVTSHATLVRDEHAFAARPWHLVILDEAQAMKNNASRLAGAVRALDARQRIALTGTPVENHLGELHSLLSWAAPGVLGTAKAIAAIFRQPIEESGDLARRDLLRRRVAPFLLRRTKQAVANDLPAKLEIDVPVELGPAQRRLYETLRLAMDQRVRDAVAERGLAKSGMEMLEALLRLRQACCDPRLLPGKLAKQITESAKLAALTELIGTLVDEGRQVLVFSQFTSLIDLIESEVMTPLGTPWLRLDGTTTARGEVVERFQRGEAPVFLLSLKAGGTGLTLTAADSVILVDPWWNPAVERQAADRAHRIGQDKPVTVYRLIASGTIEERIRHLQARKSALADALVDETGQALGKLSLADIEALLAPIEVVGG